MTAEVYFNQIKEMVDLAREKQTIDSDVNQKLDDYLQMYLDSQDKTPTQAIELINLVTQLYRQIHHHKNEHKESDVKHKVLEKLLSVFTYISKQENVELHQLEALDPRVIITILVICFKSKEKIKVIEYPPIVDLIARQIHVATARGAFDEFNKFALKWISGCSRIYDDEKIIAALFPASMGLNNWINEQLQTRGPDEELYLNLFRYALATNNLSKENFDRFYKHKLGTFSYVQIPDWLIKNKADKYFLDALKISDPILLEKEKPTYITNQTKERLMYLLELLASVKHDFMTNEATLYSLETAILNKITGFHDITFSEIMHIMLFKRKITRRNQPNSESVTNPRNMSYQSLINNFIRNCAKITIDDKNDFENIVDLILVYSGINEMAMRDFEPARCTLLSQAILKCTSEDPNLLSEFFIFLLAKFGAITSNILSWVTRLPPNPTPQQVAIVKAQEDHEKKKIPQLDSAALLHVLQCTGDNITDEKLVRLFNLIHGNADYSKIFIMLSNQKSLPDRILGFGIMYPSCVTFKRSLYSNYGRSDITKLFYNPINYLINKEKDLNTDDVDRITQYLQGLCYVYLTKGDMVKILKKTLSNSRFMATISQLTNEQQQLAAYQCLTALFDRIFSVSGKPILNTFTLGVAEIELLFNFKSTLLASKGIEPKQIKKTLYDGLMRIVLGLHYRVSTYDKSTPTSDNYQKYKQLALELLVKFDYLDEKNDQNRPRSEINKLHDIIIGILKSEIDQTLQSYIKNNFDTIFKFLERHYSQKVLFKPTVPRRNPDPHMDVMICPTKELVEHIIESKLYQFLSNKNKRRLVNWIESDIFSDYNNWLKLPEDLLNLIKTKPRQLKGIIMPAKYLEGVDADHDDVSSNPAANNAWRSRPTYSLSNLVTDKTNPQVISGNTGILHADYLTLDSNAFFSATRLTFVLCGRGKTGLAPTETGTGRVVLVITEKQLDEMHDALGSNQDILVIKSFKGIPEHLIGHPCSRRKAIYEFARSFGLKHFFMLDDNIAALYASPAILAVNASWQDFYALCETKSISGKFACIGMSPFAPKVDHEACDASIFTVKPGNIGSKILFINFEVMGKDNIYTDDLFPQDASRGCEDLYMQYCLHFAGFNIGCINRHAMIYLRANFPNAASKAVGKANVWKGEIAASLPAFARLAIEQLQFNVDESTDHHTREAKRAENADLSLDVNKVLAPAAANEDRMDVDVTQNKEVTKYDKKQSESIELVSADQTIDNDKLLSDLQQALAAAEIDSIGGTKVSKPFHPHQVAGFKATAAFLENKNRLGHYEVATGAGKTLMFTAISNTVLRSPNMKGNILILTTRIDLVQQSVERMMQFHKDNDENESKFYAVHSRGVKPKRILNLNRVREGGCVILCCINSFQKIIETNPDFISLFPVIMVDEFHTFSESQMRYFSSRADKNHLVLLFSATPGKNRALGGERIFHYTRHQGVVDKRLAPWKIDRFPYASDQMGKLKEWLPHCLKYRHLPSGGTFEENQGIIFVSSIEEANELEKLLLQHQINACAIHSEKMYQEVILDKYKRREICVLIAVNMLITGFDALVDYELILKPKMSLIDFEQAFGRVIRLDKTNKHQPSAYFMILPDYELPPEYQCPVALPALDISYTLQDIPKQLPEAEMTLIPVSHQDSRLNATKQGYLYQRNLANSRANLHKVGFFSDREYTLRGSIRNNQRIAQLPSLDNAEKIELLTCLGEILESANTLTLPTDIRVCLYKFIVDATTGARNYELAQVQGNGDNTVYLYQSERTMPESGVSYVHCDLLIRKQPEANSPRPQL